MKVDKSYPFCTSNLYIQKCKTFNCPSGHISINRTADKIIQIIFLLSITFLFLKPSTIQTMILLAIFLPWLSFLLRGKILSGIVCLILQITLIGWIPAALWAVVSLSNARADRRTDKIVKAIRENRN